MSRRKAAEEGMIESEPAGRLRKTDVIMGKRGGAIIHNEHFRKLAETFRVEYLRAKKLRKHAVAERLIQKIAEMKPPGRFVVQRGAEGSGSYFIAPNADALEKTKQLLREKGARSKVAKPDKDEEDSEDQEDVKQRSVRSSRRSPRRSGTARRGGATFKRTTKKRVDRKRRSAGNSQSLSLLQALGTRRSPRLLATPESALSSSISQQPQADKATPRSESSESNENEGSSGSDTPSDGDDPDFSASTDDAEDSSTEDEDETVDCTSSPIDKERPVQSSPSPASSDPSTSGGVKAEGIEDEAQGVVPMDVVSSSPDNEHVQSSGNETASSSGSTSDDPDSTGEDEEAEEAVPMDCVSSSVHPRAQTRCQARHSEQKGEGALDLIPPSMRSVYESRVLAKEEEDGDGDEDQLLPAPPDMPQAEEAGLPEDEDDDEEEVAGAPMAILPALAESDPEECDNEEETFVRDIMVDKNPAVDPRPEAQQPFAQPSSSVTATSAFGSIEPLDSFDSFEEASEDAAADSTEGDIEAAASGSAGLMPTRTNDSAAQKPQGVAKPSHEGGSVGDGHHAAFPCPPPPIPSFHAFLGHQVHYQLSAVARSSAENQGDEARPTAAAGLSSSRELAAAALWNEQEHTNWLDYSYLPLLVSVGSEDSGELGDNHPEPNGGGGGGGGSGGSDGCAMMQLGLACHCNFNYRNADAE